MATKSMSDVCRLCSKSENLIWVFDKKRESTNNLKEVVYMTTGVEILDKDVISQKICEKCHQISSKMFQFRQQSLKNDKYLKQQYKELVENSNSKDKTKPRASADKKSENLSDEPKKVVTPKPAYAIHPSINQLFKVYPQIKLPTICLKKHIDPFVSMQMDAVEDYFKKNKLNFQKATQHALRWDKKIATKKTLAKDLKQTTPVKVKSIDIKQKIKIKAQSDPLQISSEPVAGTASAPNNSEKIHPINIKRNQGKDKSSYKIVNVSNIIDDKTDKDSVKSSDDGKPSISKNQYRKRALSDNDFSSEPDTKKPSIMEAVGLKPKKPDGESGTLYVEKSVALFLCNICNSVQYSERSLKKHMEKHLKCQFCKAKFKTMDLKTEHIHSYCLIKNMMNNLPSVLLEKIDMNLPIREDYRRAFAQFPRIPGMKNTKMFEKPKNDKDTDSHIEKSDIIEILSDDESIVKQKNDAEVMPKNCFIHENNNVTSTTEKRLVEATTSSITPVPSISENLEASSATIQEMSISSSVVKPDIKIKNNNLLDTVDPKAGDIKVVKELLVKYKNIKLEADCSTQTEMPSSASISMHHGDLTTELKFLKHLLLVYKVPVEIKKGSFSVDYSYQQLSKHQKKLDLWNDLVPVDLKCPNVNATVSANSPVDIPSPNYRLVGGIKTVPPSTCNRVDNQISMTNNIFNEQTSASATCTMSQSPVSTISLAAQKPAAVFPPVYSVTNNVKTTSVIPHATRCIVPQTSHDVLDLSNLSVPQSTANASVGFMRENPLPSVMNTSNSCALQNNSTLSSVGVNQFHSRNNVDNNGTTSTVSTVATETVNIPIPGTIRVKNVWELK